ncbi:MAG: MmcQ/YjbR family DNA-binding protein [Actinomycetota bacterium]|nr:MmcQ/YjbR family DNA-binding protein [Actinomycetota bacterium]
MRSIDSQTICGWCEAKPGSVLEYPFGPEAAVFKVRGKMFALVAVDGPPDYVTLKADPEEGEALRAQHSFIREGYYMNKRHWITVDIEPDTPAPLVEDLVDDSYDLVVSKLPKRVRTELGLEMA